MLFLKALAFCGKKVIFAALCFYLYELKKCVSDFQNLIQNGDINNFVLRCVFVSRFVRLKSYFPDERDSGEI